MTKDNLIDLVERRIRFLSVWKEISKRKKAFEPMQSIFTLLEADYDKCIVPLNDAERIYVHFKSPDNYERIVSTKLGRYLVKHYKDYVPADHILADFVANLNSHIWKQPPQINVYRGVDLMSAYERCGESKCVGSCMTKEGKHQYMSMLANNPDIVEIHCLEDIDTIYARVLVWTLEDGKKVVDRIYPNTGDNFHKMLEHFSKLNNHYIRNHHRAYDVLKEPVEIIGLDYNPHVVLNCANQTLYPYLDTFQYGCKMDEKMFLSVKKSIDPKTTLRLNSQYGTYGNANDDE